MKQLYKAVLGKANIDYYQNKFEKFDRKGKGLKVSWNWAALLFTGIWALYRKMYGWFFLFWFIAFISHIFEEIGQSEISAVVIGIPAILFAIFSNSIYQKKLTKKIIQAEKKFDDDEDRKLEYLHRKGGVNKWVLWVFLILPILAIIVTIFIPLISNDFDNEEKNKDSLSTSSYVTAICINPSLSNEDNFSNCLSVAKQGDEEAQEIIGDMYYFGNGVVQNYASSFNWIKKSAEQYNTSAQFKLGLMYFEGKGVTQDYKKSFNWYLIAANQGFSPAQLNLAYLYFNGFGVVQDYNESAKWNKVSAEQGETAAQLRLGFMYLNGRGVEENHVEGLKWLSKAAYKNIKYQKMLGDLYFFGKRIKQNYAEAFKWYLLAAQQGDSESQYMIAVQYAEGRGVPKNIHIAFEWFEKSALQGYEVAQYSLGFLYELGNGVKQDYKKAFKLYMLSSKKNHKISQFSLAILYCLGKGVPKDLNKCALWAKKARNNGQNVDTLWNKYELWRF